MAEFLFIKSVRASAKIALPKFKLSLKAGKMVGKCVMHLNIKLISIIQSNAREQVSLPLALEAVCSIFPTELGLLAINAGNRSIIRFQNGLIDYEPEVTICENLGLMDGNRKRSFIRVFGKGISGLSSIYKVSVQKAAKDIVCMKLGCLANTVGQLAKSFVGSSNTLEKTHIDWALNIMPSQLMNHARTEAARLEMLWISGDIEYEPKVKESRKERKQKVKKHKPSN